METAALDKVEEIVEGYNHSNTDRRYNENGSAGYDLKTIKTFHEEIARLSATGLRPFQIAKALNCSPVTVKNVLKDDAVAALVAILKRARTANAINLSEKAAELAPDALTLMREVITFRPGQAIDLTSADLDGMSKDELAECEEAVRMAISPPKISDQIKAATEVMKVAIPKIQIKHKRKTIVTKSLIDEIKDTANKEQLIQEETKNSVETEVTQNGS